MNQQHLEEKLWAFAEGQLSPKEQKNLEEALTVDPALSASWYLVRSTHAALILQPQVAPAPATLQEQVLHRIAKLESTSYYHLPKVGTPIWTLVSLSVIIILWMAYTLASDGRAVEWTSLTDLTKWDGIRLWIQDYGYFLVSILWMCPLLWYMDRCLERRSYKSLGLLTI